MGTVVGVGIDAVGISRMRRALERTAGFAARVFTERETAAATGRTGELRAGRLAGRFAAKEAVAKALGTGVSGFSFRDVEVLNDDLGRPYVQLHAGAGELARQLGITEVLISITTSGDLAIANAVARA